MLLRSRGRAATSRMRSFDPRAVGALETRAWETYYRRRWGACLVAFVRLVRAAFRMPWPRTLAGAYLVLLANMRWAPYPDNDPDSARRFMTRFYRLLRASEGASFAPPPIGMRAFVASRTRSRRPAWSRTSPMISSDTPAE